MWQLERVTALAVAGLALSACSNGDVEATKPQPTVTVTETVTATDPEPDDQEDVAGDLPAEEEEVSGEDVGSIGDTVTNSGVEMTLHEAYLTETIPWNESGQRADSPGYEITSLPADNGQWFVLETTVNNVGAVSMDLTCGWPIDAVAVDSEEREFDTIDSLYQYEDNPGCNDNLQPGFDAAMTYVFNVPEDAEMIGMAFRDTEESGWEDYSAFVFEEVID